MPIPSQIAHAAGTFRANADLLAKCCDGLTSEEWHRRPGDSSNCLLWIVGHLAWARSRTLNLLGSPWSAPWLPLFERGAKPVGPAQYPPPAEVLAAWNTLCDALPGAMESVTDEILSAPFRPPSIDGKVSGMVDFLAFHETYHLGQAAYLRRWLGHEGIAG
jgi:uncharacterized damage-inducible protein DinB